MRTASILVLASALLGCSRDDKKAYSLPPSQTGPATTRPAASALLEAAADKEFGSPGYACEDTVAVARAAGMDYPAEIEKALRGDRQALRRLLVFTDYQKLDAASSEGHAAVLGELLRSVGDNAFSEALKDQPARIRKAVGENLLYDLGLDEGVDTRKVAAKFRAWTPLTAALVLESTAQRTRTR